MLVVCDVLVVVYVMLAVLPTHDLIVCNIISGTVQAIRWRIECFLITAQLE
jgi:hypothetical protein